MCALGELQAALLSHSYQCCWTTPSRLNSSAELECEGLKTKGWSGALLELDVVELTSKAECNGCVVRASPRFWVNSFETSEIVIEAYLCRDDK